MLSSDIINLGFNENSVYVNNVIMRCTCLCAHWSVFVPLLSLCLKAVCLCVIVSASPGVVFVLGRKRLFSICLLKSASSSVC